MTMFRSVTCCLTCLRTFLCLRLTQSAIASKPFHIAPPPPDPVCSYFTLQLLEPVTSLKVSKLPSIIPPKSCCLNYIPTAIIKQCSSVFSELIAYSRHSTLQV